MVEPLSSAGRQEPSQLSVLVPLKDAVHFSCPSNARKLDWGRRERFGVNLG